MIVLALRYSRSGWAGWLGSGPIVNRRILFVAIPAALLALNSATFAQERNCAAARIGAFNGAVEIRAADDRPISVRADLPLCPGDRVTTGADGGITLYFADRDTALTLDNDAELRIAGGEAAEQATLFSGIVRLVSSVRTTFTIGSDYVTAGIDGTEMTMHAVREVGAVVAVLDGVVTARRGAAAISLPPEHVSYAAAAGGLADVTGTDPAALPAVFRPYVINPAGAADWAVYFPPALIAEGAAGEVEAARLLTSGDHAAAGAALSCPAAATPTAAALCAMTAVALNDRDRLRALADAPAPGDPAGLVARSYVLQALGRLEEARDAAALAAAGAGGDGPLAAHAQARLAELSLILGDRETAAAAAQASADMGAPLGRAMLGFTALAAADHAAAEAHFDAAIAAGERSPLPLLGRGLAKIRRGDLTEGRRDLETAVALDPNRADLRVWLGRAYYEEGLPEKARAQFALAQRRDPDDPNAHFFAALERFAANDPVAALREVEAAEAAGPGRAVLRSGRGLGEDAAVRGAALGRVHDALGFDTLAARAGADAVDRDPTNPEAHRFLAETYRGQRGREIAQTSETLRADLLAPPSKTPFQAQLGETDLALLDTAGPTSPTFAEFAPLFDANGVSLFGAGEVGTQSLFGHEASVSVLHDRFSFALGEFHHRTDGFRDNNDIEHWVAAAQAKFAATPDLTFFAEYRYRQTEAGERELGFILDEGFDPDVRNEFDRHSARLGFRYDAGGGVLLGLGTWATLDTLRSDIVFEGFGFRQTDFTDTEEEFWGGELQYMTRIHGADLTVGVAASKVDGDSASITAFEFEAFPDFNFTIESFAPSDHEQIGGYAYASFDLPASVRWTLGAAVESFDGDEVGSETRFHPKAGVVVEAAEGLTLRAAYTSVTKRRLVLDQTLEPTTVAGFNQFFDAFNGAEISQAAAAIDFRATEDLFLGAEAALRWYSTPGASGDLESTEQSYRAYANHILGDRIALSGEVAYEIVEDDSGFIFDEIRTFSVPLKARYFHPSGVFAGAGLTYVNQEFTDLFGVERSDSFVIADLGVGYRLPNRRGVASLSVNNLFDQSFNYQETTPSLAAINAPTYARELTVTARLTLSY